MAFKSSGSLGFGDINRHRLLGCHRDKLLPCMLRDVAKREAHAEHGDRECKKAARERSLRGGERDALGHGLRF